VAPGWPFEVKPLIRVLWQNLLQRTREMGLRRAAGASRGGPH
jgi:hypothetical protein